jgi:23S rRNA (adenine2503-C2)-methyltransferase
MQGTGTSNKSATDARDIEAKTNLSKTAPPTMNSLTDLRSLSHSQLVGLVQSLNAPQFRVKQIEEWLWQKNTKSIDDMSNLPLTLRSKLACKFTVRGAVETARQESSDGSRKYLLRFFDGTSVECVGLPSKNRLTVCVSTQAGCAMGCAFCATGASGFIRNLSSAEIYSQVLHVRDDFNTRVTGVVMMGQGEPFMNYDATIAALRRLNSPNATGIGARHLTVSTSGVIPMIYKFSKEPEQFTLAVSLHSAIQKTRDALMPGVRKYSLLHLHEAMLNYVDKTGRRPTYEYALIKGVNDSDEDLYALCDFCRGTLSHVNLIRLNKVADLPFQPAADTRADEFLRTLERNGVEATIRKSRGSDIDAACGQLHQMHSRR